MHLIDTHCHLNLIVKEGFETPLTQNDIDQAQAVITQAANDHVKTIINVGTSLIESNNCIQLARAYKSVFSTVGIHPTDWTPQVSKDLAEMKSWLSKKRENKIVGIGECGIDLFHKKSTLSEQRSLFKEQIELSLEHDLALVVHSRDGYDETLQILEEYKNDIKKGIIHCFSYDLAFAQTTIDWSFAIGIGGTITYPKNVELRKIVQTIPLESIVLETDAPFLPPQHIRGKKNHPKEIFHIASFLADLRNDSVETIAEITTKTARRIFNIEDHA